MPQADEATLSLAGAAKPPFEGLVWGYRFDEDGQAKSLDGPAATAALERQDTWIWLHFDLIDGRARDALGRLESLPLEAREVLLGTDTRQRIGTYGQVIAGVVAESANGGTGPALYGVLAVLYGAPRVHIGPPFPASHDGRGACGGAGGSPFRQCSGSF